MSKMALLLFGWLLTGVSLVNATRQCEQGDYHPEFTECDSGKGRWRVWVPKPDCEGGAPPPVPPQRFPNCDTECEPGKYLDMYNEMKCKPCQPGSYSLGVTYRFDQWSQELFSASNFAVITEWESTRWFTNCSSQGWRIVEDKLVVAMADDCTTELIYTVKLTRAGNLRFTYQYTDTSVTFNFEASNGRCSASDAVESDFTAILTDANDVDHFEDFGTALPIGVNVLRWKVSRYLPMSGRWRPGAISPRFLVPQVRIGAIEVSGLPFVPRCTLCPPGTFATGGNDSCAPCPANTFSRGGATACIACEASEYAFMGADTCRKRPACAERDYVVRPTECVAGRAHLQAYWITPKVCLGGVDLPTYNTTITCHRCNPGMAPRRIGRNDSDNRFVCEVCPSDRPYSDGDTDCRTCPPNTVAQMGVVYNWFNAMPSEMHSSCMSMHADPCPDGAGGWQPAGSYLQTTALRLADDNTVEFFQLLTLHVKEGFIMPQAMRSQSMDSAERTYARLNLELEVDCAQGHSCSLFLSENRVYAGISTRSTLMHEWRQSVTKAVFPFAIHSPDAVTFTFAFSYNVTTANASNSSHASVARIRAVSLSNVVGAGATSCKRCDNTKDEQCIPCVDGMYLTQTGACHPCPANSISFASRLYTLFDDTPRGIEACIACGTGLKPDASRSRCVLDCSSPLPFGNNYTLDLSAFSGVHTLTSRRLFSPQGQPFYYLFNFTVCQHDTLAHCVLPSNASERRTHVHSAFGALATPDDENVRFGQQACYVTVLPNFYEPKAKSRATSLPTAADGLFSPVNLGASIERVIAPGQDEPMRANLSKLLVEGGFSTPQVDSDVFVVYDSVESSDACPAGRYLIVTLRCDVRVSKNASSIELPPNCPEGTCDGCVYLALWRSRVACRVCDPLTDVRAISGECVRGKQKVYYQAAPECYLQDETQLLARTETRSCPYLPLEAYVALAVAVLLVLLACTAVCVFRAKTKSLEFKYMRLVHQSGDQYGGELAGAESCAVQEGELDESVLDTPQRKFANRRIGALDEHSAPVSDEDELNVNFKNMKLQPMRCDSSEPKSSALSRILGRLTNSEDRGSSLMTEEDDA